MISLENLSDEQFQALHLRVARAEKVDRARSHFLDFVQLMRPHPDFPDDCSKSMIEITPLVLLLCEVVEKIDRGELKRVCLSVGPQLGKSELLSRLAPAWLSGRKARRHMILASYNDTFASEFGGDVRDIFNSGPFKEVFPDHDLKRGSEAKDSLQTTFGGKMAFVGVGGSGTGKPADAFFIDDPFKNDEDGQSESYREKVYKWYASVAFARCHKESAIVIVHTRWNQDDLIGRLCDEDHPERNKRYKGIAQRWKYYNLPAIVQDPALAASLGLTLKKPTDPFVIEMFGCEPMVALWENRKSLEFLAEAKQTDDRVFGALYMGRPSPDNGTYFTSDMLVEYAPEDLPKDLRIYAASDHGASKKNSADPSVLGCVGVDSKGDIWVFPDIVWRRMETDTTVEEMIMQMQAHKPMLWWMEDELISKSFGPFLKRRMHEKKVYTTMLIPKRPSKDKVLRARSVQGRMSMQKVHFPGWVHWWHDAKKQILAFPYGAHDDFVDWLAWIGLGLLEEISASIIEDETKTMKTGTIGWVKKSSEAVRQQKHLKLVSKGW